MTDGSIAHFRVAGAVADEKPVIFHARIIVIPGNADDRRAASDEVPDDVVFHAAINQQDPGPAFAVCNHFPAAYGIDKVLLVGIDEINVIVSENDLAQHGAFFPDDLGQRAGIDAIQPRNFIFFQPVAEALGGAPVAVLFRVIGNDERCYLYPFRLEEIGQPVGQSDARNTVIADQRICSNQDLPGVRRVGQAFGVTGHRGVENHFAGHRPFISEGFSRKNGAVFQH